MNKYTEINSKRNKEEITMSLKIRLQCFYLKNFVVPFIYTKAFFQKTVKISG